MIKKIDISEAISLKNTVFVDVRSPKEYEIDTIPLSINIPILTDEEREHVGHIYKNVDPTKAKEIGLEYASRKLVFFYKEIKKMLDENKNIALFCYRGGMRSNSIANVLDTMGLDVYIITGGYKSYRNYVINSLLTFENKFRYIVLHGYTGVGKTKILKLLSEKGMSVLDLEGLAKNTGSVFGSLGYSGESNTQKIFESLLLQSFKEMDCNIVFTESESKRIGRVILPDFLYNDMKSGYHILLKTNIDKRIDNIKDDYLRTDIANLNDVLISAIENLRKRLGNQKIDVLIEKVKEEKYSDVIEALMIDYYDPLYSYSINKVEKYDKIIEYDDENEIVNQLIEFSTNIAMDRKEIPDDI